jgi:hydrogenase/urease accessory protein HupE
MNRGYWLLAILLVLSAHTRADEIRPGYLELRETIAFNYSVVWKVPAKGEMQLGLTPVLPASCFNHSEPVARNVGGAIVYRYMLVCENGLVGQEIGIEGLENTYTDVLVRIESKDGHSQTVRLSARQPSFLVAESESYLDIAATYLGLGVEHILLGVDHLLFVFALLLIVVGIRKLVWTITAFTLAHSITLAGATLGFMHVPQQPVEAVIALSILFLAMEILHGHQGRVGYARRYPWLVAFVFGLLHGFGFAGALAAVGLPDSAIPLALVFFNVGVEVGQLIFVASVLLLGQLVSQLKAIPRLQSEQVITYLIGSVAAYWTIDRVVLFWA